jgi:hypothetical protein
MGKSLLFQVRIFRTITATSGIPINRNGMSFLLNAP